eukprot:16435905-Heterocapsa_arctica.AAC.1
MWSLPLLDLDRPVLPKFSDFSVLDGVSAKRSAGASVQDQVRPCRHLVLSGRRAATEPQAC